VRMWLKCCFKSCNSNKIIFNVHCKIWIFWSDFLQTKRRLQESNLSHLQRFLHFLPLCQENEAIRPLFELFIIKIFKSHQNQLKFQKCTKKSTFKSKTIVFNRIFLINCHEWGVQYFWAILKIFFLLFF
jgi:hypothetical protein